MSGAPPFDGDRHTLPAFTPDDLVEPEPLPGPQLGDYIVIRRIGQGGMGIVYEGVQPVIGKRVAIKVLKPHVAGDPMHVRRLLAEAQLVNAIGHRGIVDIFGFGELKDGRHYVVMEYLVGTSLDALVRGGQPLAPSTVMFILDEVLSALSAAHAKGVIHRDLKPSNIFLVNEESGNRYVKLLDFGLAKQLDPSHGSHTTRVVGTPAYMAPEQALGEKLEPRTDLYALGVVAFELLTGRLPFESNNFAEMMRRHVEEAPPRPSTLTPSIPLALEALVLKLLAKSPADRPSSAEAVRNELKAIRRAMLGPDNADVAAVGALEKAPDASQQHDTIIVPLTEHATPDGGSTGQSGEAPHRIDLPERQRLPRAMLAFAGALVLLVGVALWRASLPPPAAASAKPASGVAAAIDRLGEGAPQPNQSSAAMASSSAPPGPTSAALSSSSAPAEADSAQRAPSSPPVERLPTDRTRPTRVLRESQKPPSNPAGTGILELVPTANTWAYVSIDGKSHKQCPELPPICELELEAGPHRIDVHGPNVKPASYSVRVQPGKRARLHIRLSPAR